MAKTYFEPGGEIPVYAECDILVVGSGAAGHSAAVAAARAGAKNIILMERYGYSGGDVTGDYVLMVPKLSWKTLPFVRGIQDGRPNEIFWDQLCDRDDVSITMDLFDYGLAILKPRFFKQHYVVSF